MSDSERKPVQHFTVIRTLSQLRLAEGRLLEAYQLGETTIELAKAIYGTTHPQVGYALKIQAQVSMKMNRLEESEKFLEVGIGILLGTWGLENSAVLDMQLLLAKVYRQQGRLEEALMLAEQHRNIRVRQAGELDALSFRLTKLVAEVHCQLGQHETGIGVLFKAYQNVIEQGGSLHPTSLLYVARLVNLLRGLSRPQEAFNFCLEHKKMIDPQKLTLDLEMIFFMESEAFVLRSLSKHEEAVPVLQSCYEWRRCQYGNAHMATLFTWEELADTLGRTGQAHLAVTMLREAQAIRMEEYGRDDPELRWVEAAIGRWQREAASLTDVSTGENMLLE